MSKFTMEAIMGNSLYNKIYLGRASVCSRTVRVALVLGAAAIAGFGLLRSRR
jgi:hypothetical protein